MAEAPADVLLISQYYKPELIGSAPYCADMAEWLAGGGARIQVLAGLPHYPDNVVFPGYRGGGRLEETIDGLPVRRIRSWIPPRRTALARIAGEVDFLLRCLAAIAAGRVERRRLVLSICPSILTVAVGIAATRRGGRHVAVMHDIQSGLAQGLRMVGGSTLARVMRWCERWVLNRTDLVVVLTETMREQLRGNGIAVPIELLPIWVDTDQIRPVDRPAGALPTVLYSGNLGRKQGLDQVLALAGELARRQPEVQVVLRGNGGEAGRLTAAAAERGLGNLRFAPLVPRERLSEGLAEGDVHVVPQDPDGADFAVPSKVFTIMAAARPFVTTARPGSPLWRLQQASGAFICTAPGDAAALADAVLRLIGDPALGRELGRRGRRFVESNLSKRRVLDQFCGRLAALSAS
jgi:colanic acid biosynthesis glycosyl transferase WcaI